MSADVTFTPIIPEDWWKKAGMESFIPTSRAYSSISTHLVPISEIQPPNRNPGVPCFEQDRMIPILKGFAEGLVIPPVEVNPMDDSREYRYRLQDGYHRFYASLAAGFELIPVAVKPQFDLNTL